MYKLQVQNILEDICDYQEILEESREKEDIQINHQILHCIINSYAKEIEVVPERYGNTNEWMQVDRTRVTTEQAGVVVML
jgi:hypothetical protein